MGTFSKLLVDFRKRANLSQAALAKEADVDRSYIWRLENGERETPSRSLALRLAEILDLSQPETDLWLISAGYASPHMQQLTAAGISRLMEDLTNTD